MKTLAMTLLSTALMVSLPSQANDEKPENAVSVTDVYTVMYTQKADLIAQKTQHTLQYLNYQGRLDIYEQARKTIADIGQETSQFDQQLARGETWKDSDNAAE
ncbi:hypothetical protein [Thalassotalea sp. PS06]|uniref:hypothetical protein n=1 Tax=Thalassotalea sp. PS06 TaxID=2594005 RepID=UPI0011650B67|nr:hypothetical protein [Thalassotalea sp. PS06]QDP01894.1 hypothetical protein FNC98_11435 [Thalassotalea sp. PS06]